VGPLMPQLGMLPRRPEDGVGYFSWGPTEFRAALPRTWSRETCQFVDIFLGEFGLVLRSES